MNFVNRVGSNVVISGLIGRLDLNECAGIVKRLVDPSTGRFSVEVMLPSGKKEVVAIRAINISLTKDEKQKQIAKKIADEQKFTTFRKMFEKGERGVHDAVGIYKDVSSTIRELQIMINYVVMHLVPQLQALLDAAFRDPSAIQGVFEFTRTLLERYNRMSEDNQMIYRERFCMHTAWSLPTLKILQIMKSIVGDATVGDFFAGNGLLATIASAFGVKMIASDLVPSPLPFCNIRESDAINAVKEHPGISHFVISWPPQDNPIGATFVKAILSSRKHEDPPVTIFYIGTPRDGCCATSDLFDLFHKHFNVIASEDRTPIETWSNIMIGPDGNPIFDGFVVYQQK